MNLPEIYLGYSQMLYLRHLPLACKKTADITVRENLLLVISALYLNVGLDLMTLLMGVAYQFTQVGFLTFQPGLTAR